MRLPRRRLRDRLRPRTLFLAFLVLAAGAAFLPSRWTGPVERICQPLLAPAGRYTLLSAQWVRGRAEPAAEPTAADQAPLAVLSLRIRQLEEENRQLLGIRQAVDHRYVIAPARVVGLDSLGLASVEIDRGRFGDLRVEAGSPVLMALARDASSPPAQDSTAALASFAYIGSVAHQPGPFTARVRLLTEKSPREFAAYVVNADRAKGRVEVAAKVALQGTGKESFIAKMVDWAKPIDIGDLVVLAQPEQFGLPFGFAVGQVGKIEPRIDHPQLSDLVVTPFAPARGLNKVFILLQQ